MTSTTLRVASLNVWGHPDWIGRHATRRMRAIAAEIGPLEVDLCFFQEVWTGAFRETLIEAGRRAGLTEVWHREALVGGSGLLMLSRLPLRRTHFRRYQLSGHPERIDHGDWLSGKGFVLAEVDTGAGPLVVAGTHLVAQYADDDRDAYRPHRVAQLIELAHGTRQVRAPVLAVGDFNLVDTDPQYEILRGLSGLRDVAVELDAQAPTVLRDHPYRASGEREERIDYAFTRAGERAALRAASIAGIFEEELDFDGERGAYSDHVGLLIEVELEPRGIAPTPPELAAVEAADAWLARGRERSRDRRHLHRAAAGFSLAAALTCSGGLFARRFSRRRLLRAGLAAGVAVGTGATLGAGWLAERLDRETIEHYARVGADLADLRALAERREPFITRP